MYRFRALTALAGLALALSACSDGSEPLIPGSIQVLAGDNQTAVAGSAVLVAPSVKVLSTTSKPMKGVQVTFTPPGDDAVAPSQQVTTNGQGIATLTTWTLPKRAGSHELMVSTAGLAPVKLKATAKAGGAAKLTSTSLTQQTAKVGMEVGTAPVVMVVDANNNPVEGVQVTFTPTAGQIGVLIATSDADGLARAVSWKLGFTAGQQHVTASIANAPTVTSVTFSATAEPLAPTHLRITRNLLGNPRSGIALAVQPIVQVTDSHGNAVAAPGVQVVSAVLGDVTVTNNVATTDANGAATFAGMMLAGTAGNHVLAFSTGFHVPAYAEVALEAGVPSVLVVTTQPSTTNASGERLLVQPTVEIRDNWGNRVLTSQIAVTASVMPGSLQTLSGTTTVQPIAGRAFWNDLVVTGTGQVQLRFTAFGLPDATSAAFNVPATSICAGARLALDFQLGQTTRHLTSSNDAPFCLDFTVAANAGQQYLVQFENMSMRGNSDTGVFPGTAPSSAFSITVATGAIPSSNQTTASSRFAVPGNAVHSWDFGAGEIFEIEPKEPVGGARAYVQRNNLMVDASSSNAAVAVGDTVVAYLIGIARLGISDGQQKAVVRYVDDNIIIAEDVRLPVLQRQQGGVNTFMTTAEIQAIAADYATYAKVQADRFFGGRYNATTESSGGKPIAIHTLMYQDNIWGYTFSSGNYFAWDFWVGTNGSTRGVNQQVQKNSNNLFMHEIAHMRHWGMNERAGKQVRGNRWVVEGFARATERWPIAMRLLGTTNFSRTGNVVLPFHTSSTMNSLEDVPVYTQASLSMYGGYAQSSYVFDYFADQVARTTNADWMTALGDFLVNAGTESDLNAAIARYLPGVDFGTLFTRARIAIYADDLDAGLPDWTQYHQFQLRASRTTQNPQLDPRNLWPKIVPGSTAYSDKRDIAPGSAFGYVIDGTAATGNARILLNPDRVTNGVVSVTRIK